MLTARQRWAVRIGTLVAVGLALSWPAVMDMPDELPTVALGSEWILYFERAAIMLLLTLLLLVALIRGAWQGVLPSSFSKDGIGWNAEHAEETERALDFQQTEIDELRQQIRRIAQFLDHP